MGAKKYTVIFQLNVTLRYIEPAIWRSVQLHGDTPLVKLHQILQLLFNWEDCHLHEFTAGGTRYGVPDPDDILNVQKVTDERQVTLNGIVDRVGDTFEYVYDFGDDWYHDVVLELIRLPEPEASYPRCISGARNGPPEDAGGPFGYAHYLEVLADPAHQEYEEKLEWRGPYDAEKFSVAAVNARLDKTFRKRTVKGKAR